MALTIPTLIIGFLRIRGRQVGESMGLAGYIEITQILLDCAEFANSRPTLTDNDTFIKFV